MRGRCVVAEVETRRPRARPTCPHPRPRACRAAARADTVIGEGATVITWTVYDEHHHELVAGEADALETAWRAAADEVMALGAASVAGRLLLVVDGVVARVYPGEFDGRVAALDTAFVLGDKGGAPCSIKNMTWKRQPGDGYGWLDSGVISELWPRTVANMSADACSVRIPELPTARHGRSRWTSSPPTNS